ncbi:hypothetical protein NQ176_g11211 [Zarea fungicola]|uniref:Uncharacterized protein n=1 Tax=Zarea fungicola TaxID=93591 RepID=A0ACC1MCT8_9HYPO|nr:hypothetical protein NQ176_g11211 [Lecanicillium fungicola]
MPSPCNAKIVRAFFKHGSMPEEDHTKCPTEGPYFVNPEDEKKGKDGEGKISALGMNEDQKLMAALWEMTDAIEPRRKFVF